MEQAVRFRIVGAALASAGLLVVVPLGFRNIQAMTEHAVSLPVKLVTAPVDLITPPLDSGIVDPGTGGSFADSLNGILGLLGDLGTLVSDLETPTNPAFSGIGSDLGNPDIGNLFGNLLGMLSGDLGNVLGNSDVGNAFSLFDSLVTDFSNMINELFSAFTSTSSSAAAEIATDLTMPF